MPWAGMKTLPIAAPVFTTDPAPIMLAELTVRPLQPAAQARGFLAVFDGMGVSLQPGRAKDHSPAIHRWDTQRLGSKSREGR